MTTTTAIPIPVAAGSNNGWTQIAAGAVTAVAQLKLVYPVRIVIAPAAPAVEAEGIDLTPENPVLDMGGLMGAGDVAWARALHQASRLVVVYGAAPDGGGGGSSGAAEATQLLVLGELAAIDNKTPALVRGAVPVVAKNVLNKFREAFETYTPGTVWSQTLGAGDIIALDGNAAAASYLVISKDPLSAGTVSALESVATVGMPFDAAIGLSLSQRVLGQEFAIEFVSDEPPLPTPADLAIASIQQATTTLTVTTVTPHNLRPGMRIGIRDVVQNSALNYQAIVVASTPSPTQFTANSLPGGSIPSLNAGPFASGFVYTRSALGFAPNGTSMIFENATATQASFYVRSEAGDALPSGTIAGSHAINILSTTSVQAINAAATYAFQPTNEYRLAQFLDGVQWSNVAIDSVNATTQLYKRTQVVPDPSAAYRVRVRATNNRSLTRPVAQIVSAAKTGTTTATVTTDVPHGLTTGDFVNIAGARDTANFPILATAVAVASIVNATTFTIVWGGAVTATTFGGYVARMNGGQVLIGMTGPAIQSISRTSNVVTAIAGSAWSGALIGDYVNLVGVRNAVDGASLGLDGPYRVRDIQTTSLFLEPIGSGPTGGDIASVNCGGAVIKRTDLRISFVRVLDFERLRVEIMPRPSGDMSSAVPTVIMNTPSVGILPGTVINAVTTVAVLTGGGAAEDAAAGANPVVVGGVVRTAAAPVTFVAGDAVRDTMSLGGAKIVKPYSVAEAGWSASLALTTTGAVAIAAAAGAALKRHVTALQAINTGAALVDLIILDGATERWRLPLPVNVPVVIEFPTELPTTVNTALNANLSVAGTVRVNFQGYTSA